ncbi:MAG: hypothetical protein COA80_09310 [Leeuwenhoekiella sp.]|nr:MAG: hypothetical protein COA80_09310 [Leeuwenhoekiella sp.]
MIVKTLNLILLVCSFSLILSCNTKNDDHEMSCTSSGIAYVTSVDAPTQVEINETINIAVEFQLLNGCGQFGKFIETQDGATRIIEVEATYEGCICTQDLPIRTTNYEFKVNSAGNYKLNFRSSETEFIVVTLSVN